jgi:hypothetical protein
VQAKDNIVRRVLDAAPKGDGLSFGPFTTPASTTEVDGILVVRQDGRKHQFHVALKPSLQTAAVPRLLAMASSLGPDKPLLVMAEHVNPRLAETLRTHAIAFLDTTGNAHLTRQGLYCWVVGRRRLRPAGIQTGILHQRSGLKLVFALLTDPELDRNPGDALLNLPVRGMAASSTVSVGSVSAILRELAGRGFLLEGDNGHRRLVDREALIEKWASGFAERLRPRLITHRFRATRSDWWPKTDITSADLLWGGEVAGARMTGHLKPEHITIYARVLPDAWVVRSGLQRDAEGEIMVLSPFWSPAVESRWRPAATPFSNDCVHPLLVYADLLAEGDDRDIETAKRLYDKFLRPLAAAD